MKKAAIANSATTALINLIILAPAVPPGAAIFFQTIHKFGGIVIDRLLKGLVPAFVILENGLRHIVPVYRVGAFHRRHLQKWA